MAYNPISIGSAPKRADDGVRRLLRFALGAFGVAGALGPLSAAAAEPTLLPNERAFAFSARGVDERTIEARFVIADGYYLYRDRLKFAVDPGSLGGASLPPGKVKEDQFFGRVETYRNQLVVKLPLEAAAPGRSITISAESQGCADLGVCYPPQIQKVTLLLPAAGGRPGMPVEAAPKKNSWLN
jgi:thiol:disulfide interchange protein DsbD